MMEKLILNKSVSRLDNQALYSLENGVTYLIECENYDIQDTTGGYGSLNFQCNGFQGSNAIITGFMKNITNPTNVSFVDIFFKNMVFEDCKFYNHDQMGTRSWLDGCYFLNCKFIRTAIYGEMRWTTFKNCHLVNSYLSFTYARDCELIKIKKEGRCDISRREVIKGGGSSNLEGFEDFELPSNYKPNK